MGYLKDFSDLAPLINALRFIKKRNIAFVIKLPMLSNWILLKSISF